jgi:hypothetical protein
MVLLAAMATTLLTVSRYPPLPPKQTAYQQSVTTASAATAAVASAAALPRTLAALDASEFRSALRSCCPGVASLSAAQLLQRLHDEVQLAEVSSVQNLCSLLRSRFALSSPFLCCLHFFTCRCM